MHRDVGVGDAGAQVSRGSLEAGQRRDQRAQEREHVVGPTIRQLRFRPGPHPFVGVELGRVRWEVRDAQAGIPGKRRANHRPAVDVAVVPEDQDVAAQMAEQVPEKGAGVGRANVVAMQLEIQPTAPTRGTER